MLSTLRLTGFKAFRDTGEMTLRPLTVLAGVNSGGKSSILQSLLLLKQTLEARRPTADLDLDGRFVRATSLSDLTFGRPPLRRCTVGYHLGLEVRARRYWVEKYLRSVGSAWEGDEVALHADVEVRFGHRGDDDERPGPIVTFFRETVQAVDCEIAALTLVRRKGRFACSMTGIEFSRFDETGPFVGAWWSSFLPSHLVIPSDVVDEGGYGEPLLPVFGEPLEELERQLSTRMSYLGPLREEPHAVYVRTGRGAIDIGTKGENAAQVLWLCKDELVSYALSPRSTPRRAKLIDAVADVFAHLGLGQGMRVRSDRSIVYQVLLDMVGAAPGKTVTIADVGFGISQLLPIVVMGLRAGRDALLLLEQPEIHLHPAVQANLADFLLGLASDGRQLIVETHSDHLINRLRRRIAEDEAGGLEDCVSVLFVHPGSEDSTGAYVEPLGIDGSGTITNWPPEFLSESTNEALAIARARQRRQR